MGNVLKSLPDMDHGNLYINSRSRIKILQRRLVSVMKKIRSTTPFEYFSPDIAKGSEVWASHLDGKKINRVIIYLRSSGCTWAVANSKNQLNKFRAGCFDCEHSVTGTTHGAPISLDSYIKQFVTEFNRFNFEHYPEICIYNEGSFFNPQELPDKARIEILRIISGNQYIKSVILETLPEFITEDVLKQTKVLLGNRRVEIGLGLESSNQIVRDLCVNKSHSLEDFDSAVALIKKYFDVLAYVLIKPSFLTEAEAVKDAIDTTCYAFSRGVDVVSLEPVNPSSHNMAGILEKLGLYRPAWLWSVILVAEQVSQLGEIRIGGLQFSPVYHHNARNCDECNQKLWKKIEEFNSSGNIMVFDSISSCACKDLWRDDMMMPELPVYNRIELLIDKVESYVKLLH